MPNARVGYDCPVMKSDPFLKVYNKIIVIKNKFLNKNY